MGRGEIAPLGNSFHQEGPRSMFPFEQVRLRGKGCQELRCRQAPDKEFRLVLYRKENWVSEVNEDHTL